MATGTVYLDVDDEITSAAARIRGSEATKVALVVPYGSRIATSRMNFRLLSREAVVNNRRLSIVASDAATRALAASAGLPVFSSVAEYDSAMTGGGSPGADGPPVDPSATEAEPKAHEGRAVAAGLAAGAVAGTAAGTVGAGATGATGVAAAGALETKPKASRRKASPAEPAGPVGVETEKVAVPVPPPAAARTGPATAVAGAGAATAGASTAAGSPSIAPAPTIRLPGIRGRPMPQVGTTALIIAGIALLAVVVVGVAGYVFLPSAEISLTPNEEPIAPISLTVRADPDATETDVAAGVVPAERIDVPVEVSDTFDTQGRRVEEQAATGAVTFRNVDFTEGNTIAAGSVVSTQAGVRFTTDRAVTVGPARLVGLQIVPTEANVPVTAAKAGESGNVEPNTITVIPAAEDPQTLSVRNKAATSGGTHEEFPQVSQEEVTAALEQLNAQLIETFGNAIADRSGGSGSAIVYPETAELGSSSPTVDPATLVGQEVPSFDLGVGAMGTVIAVDDSPVKGIAESRLLANVGSDYRLVDGSIAITPGTPTVTDGQVAFPVTASASRVRILEPAELLALVKGKSFDDARAALAPFGEVEITPWPDWVASVPTVDGRVTLVIVGQDRQSGDGPAGSAAPASSAPDGSP